MTRKPKIIHIINHEDPQEEGCCPECGDPRNNAEDGLCSKCLSQDIDYLYETRRDDKI